jgi:hypothetical protein
MQRSAGEPAHRLAPRRRLDLHPRHVDAGRAVALAALAADAQVQRLLHRVARSGSHVAPELARERQAQRVGAAARQVLLVARDAKARAHRAGVELAAVAVVVAHLDRLGEAAGRVAAAAGALVASVAGSFCTFHADQSSTGFSAIVRYVGG